MDRSKFTVMAFKFENLEIWKQALELSDQVNRLAVTFPKEEMFILSSQMRRAADSAVLNIAEGSQGQSNKEYARFLNMAIRSSLEVVSCLFIAERRGYCANIPHSPIYRDAEVLIKRTQALRNKLKPNFITAILTAMTLLWSMVHGLWSRIL